MRLDKAADTELLAFYFSNNYLQSSRRWTRITGRHLLEVEDESREDLVDVRHHQDLLPGENSLLAVLARQHLTD